MNASRPASAPDNERGTDAQRILTDFALPSEPGNERRAMELVAAVVHDLGLTPPRLEKLKTAVAEATMNAMEHGNHYRPELPVSVRVLASPHNVIVLIGDQGSDAVPAITGAPPDLEAKLEGLQSPRGWGLFLIQNMVDEMRVTTDDTHHTVELVMYLRDKGVEDGGETA